MWAVYSFSFNANYNDFHPGKNFFLFQFYYLLCWVRKNYNKKKNKKGVATKK